MDTSKIQQNCFKYWTLSVTGFCPLFGCICYSEVLVCRKFVACPSKKPPLYLRFFIFVVRDRVCAFVKISLQFTYLFHITT